VAFPIKAKEAWRRWKHDWLSFERHDPQVDFGKVGVKFVDLLFAAVVGAPVASIGAVVPNPACQLVPIIHGNPVDPDQLDRLP
jgi:hypothetical protein